MARSGEAAVRRLAYARELRRILLLLSGADWETVYEDLIINLPMMLPTAEELELLDLEEIDTMLCEEDDARHLDS